MSTLILIYHADTVDRECLATHAGDEMASAQAVFPDTVRQWVKDRSILRKWRAWDTVLLYTHDRSVAPDPMRAAWAARWLGKRTFIADAQSPPVPLNVVELAAISGRYLSDSLRAQRWLKQLDVDLQRFEGLLASSSRSPVLDISHPVAYLRTDLIVHLKAGGSVGHIAGVLNNLERFTGATPIFFTADSLPTIAHHIETHHIRPTSQDRWMLRGMAASVFSSYYSRQVMRLVAGRKISFIYQRHCLDNWSGAELALTHDIPFVLEYNGSEVWVARNWGRPVKHEAVSLRVEELALRTADCIVVVSQPLKEELTGRGIQAEKVLVNPNGVNPDVYHPGVDGSAVRGKFDLEGRLVIGFIGTFGKWHGAEKLAEAFAFLIKRRPDLRQNTRLFYIGDGVMRSATEEILERGGVRDLAVFAGTVSQTEGPSHLASCDILAAPHVPNVDGSKFFGSPTKLFEYMAMGKAIAASALEQMDEVLDDGVTALKAVPGDANDLALILERLTRDEALRARLGAAARKAAVERHSWREHTRRIVEFLKGRCA
ncbi:MAG: glycosyltransferase [Desulfomonile tiedjei]|uniref:Glycosyltransferase n=1 Tax=Desulfomonile tiedjei TaxID=2358 RepID=A0A9D6V2T4_9BACT|nr:glycosyltransferase [Desulfomonile tiedjei]